MKVYVKDKKYPPEYQEVLKELENIIDPISGDNILDANLLAGLEVNDDTLKLWLAFESNTCDAIIGGVAVSNSRIIGNIMERFALVKFPRVYIYDLHNNVLAKFEMKGEK